MKRDILTYTGTLDLLNYNDTGIYFWYKRQEGSLVTKGIPVPKYYWKIVYDTKENQGAGFLGLNDPHSENLTETDYLCKPNVCDQIGWFKENVRNHDVEEKGHITCCTIQDLAKVVKNVNTFKTDQGQSISNTPSLLSCSLTCDEEKSTCNLCKPLV